MIDLLGISSTQLMLFQRFVWLYFKLTVQSVTISKSSGLIVAGRGTTINQRQQKQILRITANEINCQLLLQDMFFPMD